MLHAAVAPLISPDRLALLEAIEPHVVFDGWSDAAWKAALAALDMTEADARVAAPRGPVDLAIAYHHRGDARMLEAITAADWSETRYSAKVAQAVWLRLEGADREIVRRGSTLFAMPTHAADGAALIWGTADLIWQALGDTSDDLNWYSKRAILSGVYGSVVLFWLGDESGGDDTRAFIDRRIADVIRFEKFKATARDNPMLKPFAEGLGRLFGSVRAPSRTPPSDLPGHWTPTGQDPS